MKNKQWNQNCICASSFEITIGGKDNVLIFGLMFSVELNHGSTNVQCRAEPRKYNVSFLLLMQIILNLYLKYLCGYIVLDEIKTVHDWRYFIGGYRTAEAQRHIMMVVAFDSPNCKYKNIAKRRKSQISSTITCGNNFESMHTIGIFVIVH